MENSKQTTTLLYTSDVFLNRKYKRFEKESTFVLLPCYFRVCSIRTNKLLSSLFRTLSAASCTKRMMSPLFWFLLLPALGLCWRNLNWERFPTMTNWCFQVLNTHRVEVLCLNVLRYTAKLQSCFQKWQRHNQQPTKVTFAKFRLVSMDWQCTPNLDAHKLLLLSWCLFLFFSFFNFPCSGCFHMVICLSSTPSILREVSLSVHHHKCIKIFACFGVNVCLLLCKFEDFDSRWISSSQPVLGLPTRN